jgi:hypothetical protein
VDNWSTSVKFPVGADISLLSVVSRLALGLNQYWIHFI